MKKMIGGLMVLAAFMAYSPMANAELGQRLTTPVAEVFMDTGTCRTIAIASHTPTNVLTTAVVTQDALGIEVYNINATVPVNCGFDTAISTISTAQNYAREVLPKTGVWFGFARKFITSFFCMSQGANVTSRVTICGGK